MTSTFSDLSCIFITVRGEPLTRRITGCFKTTPQGALMNDAGLRLAESLLNTRVRRYKMRQMSMPDASGGGRMIEMDDNVVRRVEGIDELVPEDRPF
jgi:hypothetical protein